jgi:hypothetical protein
VRIIGGILWISVVGWIIWLYLTRDRMEPLKVLIEDSTRVAIQCRIGMCQARILGIMTHPDGFWTNDSLDQKARESGWLVAEGVTYGGEPYRYAYCPVHKKQFWDSE